VADGKHFQLCQSSQKAKYAISDILWTGDMEGPEICIAGKELKRALGKSG
jgi:hypothetical protein